MGPAQEVELSRRAEVGQCQGWAGTKALLVSLAHRHSGPASPPPPPGRGRRHWADSCRPPERISYRPLGRGGGGPTWGLYPLIVVGIHADLVLLHVEGELTQLHGPQLVVAVQVGPSPQAAVDDMGEPLPMGHLQAAIQGPVQTGRRGTAEWIGLTFSLTSACTAAPGS